MIKILIVDDNMHYAINLFNYINRRRNNIQICGIACNGQQAIEMINKNYADIILLDLKLPQCTGEEILKKITNKNRYNKSIIIISGENDLMQKLSDNSMIYSIINKISGMENIALKINEIINFKENKTNNLDLRGAIINELLYLGYDISHKGTRYLIKVIEYVAQNPQMDIENLNKYIYPIISKQSNTTTNNIKCSINRANNSMYYECEAEKLKRYFKFSKDAKPNTKIIITTIINKIIYNNRGKIYENNIKIINQ